MDETLTKQDAEQAVPFTTAFDIPAILDEVKHTGEQIADLRSREEQVLLEGSDSEFWELLKKRLQLRIASLRKAPSVRLHSGRIDLQEIGFRAVIINEVADGLQDIISLVELPKKKRLAQLAEDKGGE